MLELSAGATEDLTGAGAAGVIGSLKARTAARSGIAPPFSVEQFFA
jgi:hypothetical protein